MICMVSHTMWNSMGFLYYLTHCGLARGMLVSLFLSCIPVRALTSGNNYHTIKTHMRNSTSLVCDANHFRSIIEAAGTCHKDDDCRATMKFRENGNGRFGVCKCATGTRHTPLFNGNSELYLRANHTRTTGKMYWLKEWHNANLPRWQW